MQLIESLPNLHKPLGSIHPNQAPRGKKKKRKSEILPHQLQLITS
jgi:hypothetical protein